jgi:hypothetical protein
MLNLPGLEQIAQCSFSQWIRSGTVVWRKGGEDCDRSVRTANNGVPALADYLASLRYHNEKVRTGHHSGFPGQCGLEYLSVDGRLQKERCVSFRYGFWGPVPTKIVERITEVKAGQAVGSVEETTRDSIDSRFAAQDGRNYLILMEGGTRLRVYAITW